MNAQEIGQEIVAEFAGIGIDAEMYTNSHGWEISNTRRSFTVEFTTGDATMAEAGSRRDAFGYYCEIAKEWVIDPSDDRTGVIVLEYVRAVCRGTV